MPALDPQEDRAEGSDQPCLGSFTRKVRPSTNRWVMVHGRLSNFDKAKDRFVIFQELSRFFATFSGRRPPPNRRYDLLRDAQTLVELLDLGLGRGSRHSHCDSCQPRANPLRIVANPRAVLPSQATAAAGRCAFTLWYAFGMAVIDGLRGDGPNAGCLFELNFGNLAHVSGTEQFTARS